MVKPVHPMTNPEFEALMEHLPTQRPAHKPSIDMTCGDEKQLQCPCCTAWRAKEEKRERDEKALKETEGLALIIGCGVVFICGMALMWLLIRADIIATHLGSAG